MEKVKIGLIASLALAAGSSSGAKLGCEIRNVTCLAAHLLITTIFLLCGDEK